jgi:hypothetical protein
VTRSTGRRQGRRRTVQLHGGLHLGEHIFGRVLDVSIGPSRSRALDTIELVRHDFAGAEISMLS